MASYHTWLTATMQTAGQAKTKKTGFMVVHYIKGSSRPLRKWPKVSREGDMIIYNIFISQSQIQIPKVVLNNSGFLRLGSNNRSFRYSYFVCFLVVSNSLGSWVVSALHPCKLVEICLISWHWIGCFVFFFPRGSYCHYSTLICLNIAWVLHLWK